MAFYDCGVVQQGEPQDILMNPVDPYIEDFISDINRARVLRVRSFMTLLKKDMTFAGDIGPNDTLEALIACSEGNTGNNFRVVEGITSIYQIAMKDLVKALIPRVSASEKRAV